ncbi:solute carrier 16 [Mactra antiquata]
MYSPAHVCVIHNFKKHRSLASGIVACGSGVGNITTNQLIRLLIVYYGWKGTILLEAGLVLQGVVVGLFLVRTTPDAHRKPVDMSHSKQSCTVSGIENSMFTINDVVEENSVNNEAIDEHCSRSYLDSSVPNIKNQIGKDITNSVANNCEEISNTGKFNLTEMLKSICDLNLLKDVRCILILIAMYMFALGYIIPFTFLPDQVIESGLTKQEAVWLTSSIGITGTVSRFGFGILGDRPFVNKHILLASLMMLCGIVTGLSPLMVTMATKIIYCCLFGALFGGFVSIYPVVLTDIFGDKMFAKSYGLVLTFFGLGVVSGTPIGGPITSGLSDLYGSRIMVVPGAIISSAGFLLSFFATNVYHLWITFGVLGGIGFAMMYSPAHVCVIHNFKKHRSLASGIVACGTGVGTVTTNQVIRLLIVHYGWKGTILLQAGMVLQGVVIGLFLVRTTPDAHTKPVDMSHSKQSCTVSGMENSMFTINDVVEENSVNNEAIDEHCSRSYLDSSKPNVESQIRKDITNSVAYNCDEISNTGKFNIIEMLKSICDLSLLKDVRCILILSAIFMFALGYIIPVTFLPDQVIESGLTKQEAVWLTSSIGGFVSIYPVVLTDIFGDKMFAKSYGLVLTFFGLGVVSGTPIGGPITSGLADLYGSRIMVVPGAIISSAGFFLSIFATNVYHLWVTFGVLGGIGFAMMYSPAHVCVIHNFKKHRSLASGIVACGSGVGTVTTNQVIRLLIVHYGWKGTILLEAGLVLQGVVVGLFLVRTTPDAHTKSVDMSHSKQNCNVSGIENSMFTVNVVKENSLNNEVIDEHCSSSYLNSSVPNVESQIEKDITNSEANNCDEMSNTGKFNLTEMLKSICDLNLLKDARCILILSAIFMFALGYIVPFTFIPDQVIESGLTKQEAVWLTSSIGIAGTVSRFGFGILGDRPFVNRLMLLVFLMMISGILTGLSPLMVTMVTKIIYCCMFGVLIGGFVSIYPVVLTDIFGDKMFAKSYGFVLTSFGLGVVSGTPIGGYGWLAVFSGFCVSFIVDGVNFSYGILLVAIIEDFNQGRALTGAIVSITMALTCVLSPITCGLADLYGSRIIVITGAIISSAGFFLSFFATNVYHLWITFGVLGGVGSLTANQIMRPLIDHYGWKGTILLEAGLALQGVVVGLFLVLTPPNAHQNPMDVSHSKQNCTEQDKQNSVFTINGAVQDNSCYNDVKDEHCSNSYSVTSRPNVKSQFENDVTCLKENYSDGRGNTRKKFNLMKVCRSIFDFRLLKDARCILILLAVFIFALGIMIPFTFIPDQVIKSGLTKQDAVWLSSSIGISGTVGRFGFGILGDRPFVNRLILLVVLMMINGILTGLSPLMVTMVTKTIYCCLFGALFGGFISIYPVVLIDIFGDKVFSKSYGFALMSIGLGIISGTPIGGKFCRITLI